MAGNMQGSIYRLAQTSLCGAMLLAIASAADSQTGSTPRSNGHLNVVCSTSLFHGVDPAELITSSKVWLQNLAKYTGWTVNPKIELTNTVELMRKRVDEGEIDLVVSSTLEYLAIARSKSLIPMMTMMSGSGEKGKLKYLLLVSRSSSFTRIEDLKGKSLSAYSRSDSHLSRMWMEVLLEERHLSPSEQFFQSYTNASKPSVACLPLFFGKTDACLIDDASWEVLKDLNPQVGGKLRMLAESPAFVENLVSIHVNQREHKGEMTRAMMELQNNPEGRQILLFFKSQRSAMIDRQDLDSVVELQSKYLKLTETAKHKNLVSLTTVSNEGLSTAPRAR